MMLLQKEVENIQIKVTEYIEIEISTVILSLGIIA